jgi:hypothetical protein
MMGIVNATDSQLSLATLSRDRFSAAAELRAVNWAQLISTKSHGCPPAWTFQGSIEGIVSWGML